LEDTLGRAPTDKELADKLEMSIEETHDLMSKSNVLGVVSLDEFLEQNYETTFNGLTSQQQDSPESRAEKSERQAMLAEAINKLSEKEKLVVTLYYFEDLTLKEISSIMKVSESRISQIHSKAVLRLQGKLGKYKPVLFG
jgi:RNA polymerase sigma factor for flagellar operon FliA